MTRSQVHIFGLTRHYLQFLRLAVPKPVSRTSELNNGLTSRGLDHRDLIFKNLYLEEQGSHAAHLGLLFHKDLKVLVDNGHSQQNTGSRSNSSHKISQN